MVDKERMDELKQLLESESNLSINMRLDQLRNELEDTKRKFKETNRFNFKRRVELKRRRSTIIEKIRNITGR